MRERRVLGGQARAPTAWAALKGLLLCLILAPPAAGQTRLAVQSIAVTVRAVANVTDLTAQTQAGAISLTWTEPGRRGATAPEAYDIRVSTTGQIADNGDFAAARPLSAFSGSPVPSPGAGGGIANFVVTGLAGPTTYYFAIREYDSSVPALEGAWIRSVPQGWNVNNFAVGFTTTAPNAITDLTALPGSSAGAVSLAWTAPFNQDGVSISSYVVHFASFSVASLGGDTTAWFNLTASSSITVAPAHAPGSRETLTVGSLTIGTTFYFAVKSVDALGTISLIDTRAATPGNQANSLPASQIPPTPTGLAAVAGHNRVALSWNPEAAWPLATHFILQRSTLSGSGFATILSTTGLSFTDGPLVPFATYYYRLAAVDTSSATSTFTPVVSARPDSLPPMEPVGLAVPSYSAKSTTITWQAVGQLADGTAFFGSVPSSGELTGYVISRGTDPCASFAPLGTTGVSTTSFNDPNTGNGYWLYQVQSSNTVGLSSATRFIDVFGNEVFVFAPDCVSRLQVSSDRLRDLDAGGYILAYKRPQDLGGRTVVSGEFDVMKAGVRVPNFAFAGPLTIVLHFAVSGTSVVPSGLRGADLLDSEKNLGMYWNNGLESVKLYGKVDTSAQTVTVQTPNPGVYQVRTLERDSGVTFDASGLTSRVFTPNGDGKNDVVIFTFDNPNNAGVEGKIFDLRGAFVASMAPGPMSNTLMWDGRSNGRVVASGVYIYQLTGEGKTFNGTIVVAR